MLPSSLKDMKQYIRGKAAKLSLYIYARNRIQMSAKQTRYFRFRLRKSMVGAVTVEEAIALIRSEIQRLWTSNKFRTMKTFTICKQKIDEFWLKGRFPACLVYLKEDPAFKKRTLIEYFDTVAREKEEFMIRRMTDGFIPVYLQNLIDVDSD